jgi:hypothetical protein
MFLDAMQPVQRRIRFPPKPSLHVAEDSAQRPLPEKTRDWAIDCPKLGT